MADHDYPRPTPIGDWNRLLEGRVAVVTGGGTGIGGAISRLFAQHGAIVEIIDIDATVAGEAVADIEAAGGKARAHIADCRDWEQLQAAAEAIFADHAYVQVLVNNVGDFRPLERFRKSSPESWKAMYDINFFSTVASTKCFLESMIAGGGGSIVNVHSVEGMRGYPGDPIYGAMKAASAKFSTDLALSMGRNGIRVNGIGPDLTQTPQVDYISTSVGYEHLW
ncbi:MAG: SDR family oxidoreductase, partial [Acidimicrobiia bacterium]|nr:SDR family oxidoreductase [Acidimicrobiia bacterium]